MIGDQPISRNVVRVTIANILIQSAVNRASENKEPPGMVLFKTVKLNFWQLWEIKTWVESRMQLTGTHGLASA